MVDLGSTTSSVKHTESRRVSVLEGLQYHPWLPRPACHSECLAILSLKTLSDHMWPCKVFDVEYFNKLMATCKGGAVQTQSQAQSCLSLHILLEQPLLMVSPIVTAQAVSYRTADTLADVMCPAVTL